MATIALPKGRITLTRNSLTTTNEHGQKERVNVTSSVHFAALLKRYFAMELPDGIEAWRGGT